mmetsp:Transcript_44649/g.105916  ORF Transcript_44649/g.105916 Transcript_44649/m.105916 type:complete len:279 (+) Transcript_44649:747-1583(+)
MGLATASDPLLGSVDNVMLTIWSLHSGGQQVRDVGAGTWLSDGEADSLLARKNLLANLLLHPRLAKLQHWWQSNDHALAHASQESWSCKVCNFLVADSFMEVVELLLGKTARQLLNVLERGGANSGGKEALTAEKLIKLIGWGNTSCLSGLCLLAAGIQELPDIRAELLVSVIVVLRLPAHPVAGLSKWNIRDLAAVHNVNLLGALQATNLQPLLLPNDLVQVVAVEDLSHVATGMLQEDQFATWVHLGELGHIVDVTIDGDPSIPSLVVLLELLHRD